MNLEIKTLMRKVSFLEQPRETMVGENSRVKES